MNTHITELAILFGLAAVFGILGRVVRQPMIMAYLITGVVLAAFGFSPQPDDELLSLFSHLGVMFLLFLIGLEVNYSSLRIVGKSIGVTAVVQIALSMTGGILLGFLLGWPISWAVLTGVIVAFSSTVVGVKVLSEQHELQSLHGKLAIGILLIQDMVAMFMMVAFSSEIHSLALGWPMMLVLLKLALVLAVTLWIGRTVMPRVLRALGHTPELLYLVSTAWLFGVATATQQFGLSLEIGGLLAGLSMASSAEQLRIASRMRPLRDFFLALFFISLGTSLSGVNFDGVLWPALLLTGFIVFINPLIVLLTLLASGYHRRTAYLTGRVLSQLSEFGLHLATLGVALGLADGRFITIITITGILSIGLSVYLQHHAEETYRWFDRLLKYFERPGTHHAIAAARIPRYHTILIGAHRLGLALLETLPKKGTLVIDFDPEVLERVRHLGYATSYGDLSDEDMLDNIVASQPKMIISTTPSVVDTVILLQRIHGLKRKPQVIVRAEHEHDVKEYYHLGAAYVLQPHRSSGQALGHVLQKENKKLLEGWRKQDLKTIS